MRRRCPGLGDFLEYIIGDQSILITRSEPDTVRAFYNTCPHRGTRLAAGVGNFATGEIRCRYHAWRFELDGTNKEVVDRFDFPPTMTDADACLNQIQVGPVGWLRVHQHGSRTVSRSSRSLDRFPSSSRLIASRRCGSAPTVR